MKYRLDYLNMATGEPTFQSGYGERTRVEQYNSTANAGKKVSGTISIATGTTSTGDSENFRLTGVSKKGKGGL